MVQFSIRVLAMISGIFGAIIAFLTNLLYSTFHMLGRVSGITNDKSHFFYGLLVVLVSLIGSVLVPFAPIIGVVLLVIATIAFFFVVGWWAILAAIFFLIAAALAFRHSRERAHAVG